MLIDVILPTFNRAYCLKRTIDSVLSQTYQELNLYVIDDGSTDETRNLISQYQNESMVRYFFQDNKGVSAARNCGIQQGQAEWVAFVDSDDEWLPHKLETQVDFIKKNPNYRFVHSDEIWMRNDVRVNPKKKFDKSHHDLFRRSLEMCLISPSTVVIKKELCLQHGLFNENFIVCEDYDLWLKILATEEVGFISEFLIKKYGGHSDQLSTQYTAMDFWRIRSMVSLLGNKLVTDEVKRSQIKVEIRKKAEILLNGFLKHQKLNEYDELKTLIITLDELP
jgi:glycosyltransferase involved in cell wall biosynthesis